MKNISYEFLDRENVFIVRKIELLALVRLFINFHRMVCADKLTRSCAKSNVLCKYLYIMKNKYYCTHCQIPCIIKIGSVSKVHSKILGGKNMSSTIRKTSILIALITLIGLLLLFATEPVYASATSGSDWSYPSDWERLGGDTSYQTESVAYTVRNKTYFYNTDYFQGGTENTSVTIEDISVDGTPRLCIKRNFLKGEFAGKWFIAVLIDIEMDPGNADYVGNNIRSARAHIESTINKANKVGSWIITYWPTTTPAGTLTASSPYSAFYNTTTTVTVSGEAGLEVGTGGISASFGVSGSPSSTTENGALEIFAANIYSASDNEVPNALHGTKIDYAYYKPNKGSSYKESKSALKYLAIYECDSDTEYYNINTDIIGEFYYKTSGGTEVIIRGQKTQDYFMKPSTNFFKTYGVGI